VRHAISERVVVDYFVRERRIGSTPHVVLPASTWLPHIAADLPAGQRHALR
jgi:hypothetical protein